MLLAAPMRRARAGASRFTLASLALTAAVSACSPERLSSPPSAAPNASPSASVASAPGYIRIGVVPEAKDSPLDIGTMAKESWFAGAIGKVALYDKLLSQEEITSHYRTMTGKDPTGSCRATCSF